MREQQGIEWIARRRNRVAVGLTVAMMAAYFAFMASFAFAKDSLAQVVAHGVTVCMIAGPLVIVAGCLLSGIYVYWANVFHDPHVDEIAAAGGK